MSLEKLAPGKTPPRRMNAIIEIPENGHVKYEIDKETGLLKVDRILHAPMAYPANYGYFPGTLGDDGDPLDCVVVCNAPLRPGVLIEVRPIGALLMDIDVTLVDDNLALAGNQTDTGNGLLAAANSAVVNLSHLLLLLSVYYTRSKLTGFWAAWLCSAPANTCSFLAI